MLAKRKSDGSPEHDHNQEKGLLGVALLVGRNAIAGRLDDHIVDSCAMAAGLGSCYTDVVVGDDVGDVALAAAAAAVAGGEGMMMVSEALA